MTDSTMTEIPREGLVVWTLVDKLLHEAAALEALGLRDAPGICREAAAMLKAAVDALELGKRLAAQVRNDLASAHAEICKLQGLDPAMHTWPDWSAQANTLRWLTNEIEPTFDNTLASLKQGGR